MRVFSHLDDGWLVETKEILSRDVVGKDGNHFVLFAQFGNLLDDLKPSSLGRRVSKRLFDLLFGAVLTLFSDDGGDLKLGLISVVSDPTDVLGSLVHLGH